MLAVVVAAPTGAEPRSSKLTMDTRLEKRVCRIYFGGALAPRTSNGRTSWPMYGVAPEQLADIVAEMGVDLWQVY